MSGSTLVQKPGDLFGHGSATRFLGSCPICPTMSCAYTQPISIQQMTWKALAWDLEITSAPKYTGKGPGVWTTTESPSITAPLAHDLECSPRGAFQTSASSWRADARPPPACGVGSRVGISGKLNRPFSIYLHCLLVRGEAGPEGGSRPKLLGHLFSFRAVPHSSQTLRDGGSQASQVKQGPAHRPLG